MSFITLDKSDSKFRSYLMGTFSKSHIAIPVKPEQSGMVSDQMTFQVLDSRSLNRPNLFFVLFKALRVKLGMLSVLPMLFCLAFGYMFHKSMDFELGIYAFFSVLSLHCSGYLLNDFFDHLSGGDSIGISSGTQVIQKGWMRGITALKLGVLSLLVAAVLIYPVFLYKPSGLIIASLVLGFLVIGYSFLGYGFKNFGLGEVIVFLCFGPALSGGYFFVLTDIIDKSIVLFGVVFGLHSAYYVMLRNFKNILSDSQVKVGSLVSRLGFDRGKKLIVFFYLFQCLMALILFYFLLERAKGLPLVVFGGLIYALLGYFYFRKLRKIESPLSSGLMTLPRWSLYFYLTTFSLALFTLFIQNGYKYLLNFDQKIWLLMMINKLGLAF